MRCDFVGFTLSDVTWVRVCVLASQRFTIPNCSGTYIELVPGGRGVAVTPANAEHYVDLALAARLHEFDAQVRVLAAFACC